MIEVKVIEDSISEAGDRLTTLQLKYQRMIHSEFMTHRVFSRNASSSRAIPVKKMIAQVWNDPAMPVHWGKNQAGMQAYGELYGLKCKTAIGLWKLAAKGACVIAWGMTKVGLHKQVANRILEPFQYIHVVVTATEWTNFFALRDHEAAAPEIRNLAREMKWQIEGSFPRRLRRGEWHLPYVTSEEAWVLGTIIASKVSAARCARVSYLKHDGEKSSVTEDLDLYQRLVGSMPIHASPVEHQATPDTPDGNHWEHPELHGNFKGWIQNRKMVESDFKS